MQDENKTSEQLVDESMNFPSTLLAGRYVMVSEKHKDTADDGSGNNLRDWFSVRQGMRLI